MAVLEAKAGGGKFMAATTWTPEQVPTANDDCKLTATSGAVTINTAAKCRSLDCTGYTSTLTVEAQISIGSAGANGTLAMKLAGTVTIKGEKAVFAFISTNATELEILTGGKKLPGAEFKFNGAGGKWKLMEKLIVYEEGHPGVVMLLTGTLNLNGQEVETAELKTSGVLTRTLNMENALVIVSLLWAIEGTGLTMKTAGSTIEWIGTGAFFTDEVGTATYPTVIFRHASGAVEINKSTTITTFKLNNTGAGKPEVKIGEGVTVTIGTLTTTAKSGSPAILKRGGVGSTKCKLTKASGNVTVDWLQITNVETNNAVSWYAGANSTLTGETEFWKKEGGHEHTLSITQPQVVTRVTEPSRIFATIAQTQAVSMVHPETSHHTLSAAQTQVATLTLTENAVHTLSVAQAQALTMSRALERSLSASQPQAVTLIRALARTLSTAQAQSVTMSRALARMLSVSQAQVVTRVTEPNRTLTITQAQIATRTSTETAVHTLSVAQPQTIALIRAPARTLSVTQPQLPLLPKALARTLSTSDGQSATVTHGEMNLRTLTAAQPQSIGMMRSIGRTLSVSQTSAVGAPRRELHVGLSVAQTQTCSVRHSFARTLTATQPSSPTLQAVVSPTLTATQPTTVVLGKVPARTLLVTQPQEATIAAATATGKFQKMSSSVVQANLSSSVESQIAMASSVETLLVESSVD